MQPLQNVTSEESPQAQETDANGAFQEDSSKVEEQGMRHF